MSSQVKSAVPPDAIYKELRASIRETDTISFKLLGLVPLVSGTGLIALVHGSEALPLPGAMLIAIFASGVTLGLFRWELRNVQTCSWLIKVAQEIETASLADAGIELEAQFKARPDAPTLLGMRFGKTQAEKLVYPVVIVAWLMLPVASRGDFALRRGLLAVHILSATLVLLATILSIFADTHVTPPRRRP